MAMKNYKVVDDEGNEAFFQIDDSEETGKAILKALNDAAKDKDNPTKSVSEGNPAPFNK